MNNKKIPFGLPLGIVVLIIGIGYIVCMITMPHQNLNGIDLLWQFLAGVLIAGFGGYLIHKESDKPPEQYLDS